jgi:hypothetical protein
LSALRPTLKLEDQVTVFMSSVTGWFSYTLRHRVAFNDSQGYGGGFITRLHTGIQIIHNKTFFENKLKFVIIHVVQSENARQRHPFHGHQLILLFRLAVVTVPNYRALTVTESRSKHRLIRNKFIVLSVTYCPVIFSMSSPKWSVPFGFSD